MEAALRVFSRRGFGGASVEEVAEEAGFSRGAVYSNFDSKEDLFLALVEQRMVERLGVVNSTFGENKPDQAKLRATGMYLGKMTPRERDWYLLFMEAWAYFVRDAQLKRKLAADYQQIRDTIGRLFEQQYREDGLEPPRRTEDLAAAIVAMSDGFVIQALLDPSRIGAESYVSMLEIFSAGVAVLARESKSTTHEGDIR